MDRNRRILEALTRAQTQFVDHVEPRELFLGLLDALLDVTESESGFIGEVRWPNAGQPYVNVYAVGERQDRHHRSPEDTSEFRLDPITLDIVVNSLAVAQSAMAKCVPDSAGAQPLHLTDSPLGEFLGIPLASRGTIVGIIGMARTTEPYPSSLVEFLHPFAVTSANLIVAIRSDLDRQEAEATAVDQGARLRAILNSALDGIITIDAQGTIVDANPGAERIFRCPVERMVGTNINQYMPEPYARRHDEYIARFLRTGEARIIGFVREVTGKRPDGSTFPLDLAVTEVKHDQPGVGRLFTGIVRDISDRKELDRLKDELISTVSHELRTPLTSICGSLGLLEHAVAGTLPEGARNLVRVAKRNADRLVRLVNDLLDLRKIEDGRMRSVFAPVSAGGIVERTAHELSAVAREKGIELSVTLEGELWVMADRDQLIQVLTNLLANAIRHSPIGEPVSLAVTAVGDDRVRFGVRDRGDGVPEDLRERLFARYEQLGQPRTSGGTGLGLAISKALVEQHGGIIGLADYIDPGSEFYVEIPRCAVPVPNAP